MDVTELKRSEQNYREIFNATHEAIFLHDSATGRVLDVNDAALRMHGYDAREEFLARELEQIMVGGAPYDWEEARRRIRLAVEEGPQVFEWLNHRKNGEPFWVEVSMRSSQIGGQGRILAVVRDITLRKAHEHEIQRLNRLYATLSEVSQAMVRCQSRAELFDGVCRVMIEFGKFQGVRIGELDANGGLASLAQQSVDPNPAARPIDGRCWVVLDTLHKGCAALCNDFRSGEGANCCRNLWPRLEIRSCAAFPLHLQGHLFGAFSVCSSEPGFFKPEEVRMLGEIASKVSYALDLLHAQEQRRQAEEKIRELNRNLDQRVQERTAELRASNEELDAFAYAVSHDLRAPLRAMSGFSQALVEDYGSALPPEARGYLSHIQSGSREMGELIDGLLCLSRSTRGSLKRDTVDISALAARILAALRAGEPHRGVASIVEPGLVVNGDARLMEIVFFNLLGNAWKYTGRAAHPEIRVHGRADEDAKVICVTDNGAGFDMKHAAKLFLPFQRLHREDEFPGIGIGLATVQRIIRRHGGTIGATGAPGAGATFSLNLPKFEPHENT